MIKASDFLQALRRGDREEAEALFLDLGAEELGRVASALESEADRLKSNALYIMALTIRKGVLPRALFESAELREQFPSMFDP